MMVDSGLPRFILLAIYCIAAACACSSGAPPGGEDAEQRHDADHAADAGDTDDVEPGPSDADVGSMGELEVGVNRAFDFSPESFRPITDGGEVPLTLGPQGAWMVVLAFRSRDVLEGEFEVIAEMSIDGTPAGNIWLVSQSTIEGGDGWDYYYDLFLALTSAGPPEVGTPAWIAMRVIDEEGTTITREFDVIIGSFD